MRGGVTATSGFGLEDGLAELATLAGTLPRSAEDVRILRDGEAAFPAMLALIDSAERQVLFENFIFAGDATGRRFAEALAAAARRGVDVRVLYDPIGTLMVRGGSIARVLRQDGVTARPFQPLSPYMPWTWTRLRHRDHRKTLTVDRRAAVVGGLCISDDWAPSARGGRGWRDTALLVHGPVAEDVARAFEIMWQSATRPADAPEAATAPPAALLAADRPGDQRIARIYEWLAERARHTLEITDAYLVLPRRTLDALCAAAGRGVAVRLLLPGHNNHPVAGTAARRGYEQLLRAGVEIWEWQGVMIHAKTAVVDDSLVLVGSSNLDPLSLRRNYELNLLVVDPTTARGMHELFARDLTEARRIDLEAWERRPRWQRVAERVSALLAPVL
jgi:cardiolipin synthase